MVCPWRNMTVANKKHQSNYRELIIEHSPLESLERLPYCFCLKKKKLLLYVLREELLCLGEIGLAGPFWEEQLRMALLMLVRTFPPFVAPLCQILDCKVLGAGTCLERAMRTDGAVQNLTLRQTMAAFRHCNKLFCLNGGLLTKPCLV